MKQNINIEQLNELSEKGKEKLIQWTKNYYPKDIQIYRNIELDKKENFIFLSIGQMIEFLDDGWIYNRNIDKGVDVYSFNIVNNDQLCDALWEAVKEVLEGKPFDPFEGSDGRLVL